MQPRKRLRRLTALEKTSPFLLALLAVCAPVDGRAEEPPEPEASTRARPHFEELAPVIPEPTASKPEPPPPPHMKWVTEKRMNWPLIGGGIGVFSAGWIPMLIVSAVVPVDYADGGTAHLPVPLAAIPVFGAFIVAADFFSTGYYMLNAGAGFVIDGLVQAVGASMLIAGLIQRRNVGVYKTVSFAPVIARSYSGLSVTVRF
jgi:hypothetical protein